VKKLLPILLTLALLCLPSLASAGTCNASYTDTLPQTSGSAGSLPPNTPGQIPLGQITHIEATGVLDQLRDVERHHLHERPSRRLERWVCVPPQVG